MFINIELKWSIYFGFNVSVCHSFQWNRQ